MRFFHLSDLHIGKQLYHYSLFEEQRDLLAQVVAYVKKEQPDAVFLAGDIYDTPVPSAEAVAVFNEFLTALSELEQKLTICIIAGNHDSAGRLDYASQILAKQAIHIAGLPPRTKEESLKKVVLEDAYGQVAVYLLPFVKPGLVRKLFPEETLSFSEAVKRLLEREQIDTNKRNILVSHQFYAGQNVSLCLSDSELHTAGGIDNVDIRVLDAFDYAALGHIHRAQKAGAEKNRYCGTLFPYSVSEADEEKTVTMVEMGAKGEAVQITLLPLCLKRQVRKLRGTLNELLSQAECEAAAKKCHDYVSITLTDEVEAANPRECLEERYDHILELRIDNSRTRKLFETGDFETEHLDPYAAFCTFFAEMNGREMTEEEHTLLLEVLEESGGLETK